VLVIEVDAVDAEPLEAALARRPHESWVATDLPFPVGKGGAELGGQLDLLPYPTLKRLLRTKMNSSEALHRTSSVQRTGKNKKKRPETCRIDPKGLRDRERATLPRRISLVCGP